VIFAAEISNKFQKTRFWKEKSVEDVVTLGPTAHATLAYIEFTNFCKVYCITQKLAIQSNTPH
jgi:hypothetical protein